MATGHHARAVFEDGTCKVRVRVSMMGARESGREKLETVRWRLLRGLSVPVCFVKPMSSFDFTEKGPFYLKDFFLNMPLYCQHFAILHTLQKKWFSKIVH